MGKNIFTVLFALLLSFSLNASDQSHGSGDSHEKEESNQTLDHVKDSHEWHILDYTDSEGIQHPVGVPLPVILWNGKGLDIFMSSEFHHGHSAVHKGENTYVIQHDKIYFADEHGNAIGDPILWDFSITKNTLSMFMSVALLLFIFLSVAKAYRKRPGQAPKGLQSFMEPLVLFVRDEIAIPNIGEHKYHKFLPYLLTAFFFIWINNMIGLIPFFPGGANVTGNIAVTAVLSVFTLLITNLNANKAYWRHIFAMPGLPVWLIPIMTVVEIIGIFTKPFALMIRLFANITAGHIVVLSLIGLIFYFESFAFSPVSILLVLFIDVLELFVAALQAYIFTMLSALFIGLAVQDHH